jgi:hypothetical protein
MIGQRLAPWPLVGDLDVYVRTARFGAPDVAIEIFPTEGELIGIKALETAAELCPLKLFDDRLKPLDLAVTMLDDGRRFRSAWPAAPAAIRSRLDRCAW